MLIRASDRREIIPVTTSVDTVWPQAEQTAVGICAALQNPQLTVASTKRTWNVYLPRDSQGRHFWGWSCSSAVSPRALFPQPLTSATHSLHLSRPFAVAPGTRGALEAGEGQSEQALLSWLSLSPGHQTFLRKSS